MLYPFDSCCIEFLASAVPFTDEVQTASFKDPVRTAQ